MEVALPLLARGFVPRNPLHVLGVSGLWSALPYFIALAIAALLLLTAPLRLPPRWPGRRAGALIAVSVAAGLIAAQLGASNGPPDTGAARFFISIWERF